MTATRNPVNGAWQVSETIRGYLIQRQYYGFTKREAVQQFRQETKHLR